MRRPARRRPGEVVGEVGARRTARRRRHRHGGPGGFGEQPEVPGLAAVTALVTPPGEKAGHERVPGPDRVHDVDRGHGTVCSPSAVCTVTGRPRQ